MYSLEDGKLAVKVARDAIEKHLRREPHAEHKVPDLFHQKAGVFVTLEKYPDKDLRGCIGFPEPIFPLLKALKSAAVSAAVEDPRFRPVTEKEMDKIIVEVSLLTPPELVKVGNPKEYPKHIVIGRDGLIAEKGWGKGLLLPQVPVEWEWKVEEYLEQVCWKAGLTPDSWLDPEFRLYKFQAEVFSETKPGGEVVHRKLGKK
jgi:hypothetical protein